jgi:hypothetical protein
MLARTVHSALQKCLTIAFTKKNLLPIVTTRRRIIEQSFGVNSRMARHALQLPLS